MTGDIGDIEARRRRKTSAPAGAFGPGPRKQRQIDAAMEKFKTAEARGERQPTPERITTALDIAGLYGPEVDQALGGEEPMVDEWEAGTRIPTSAQVKALAMLTGFPDAFFYLPPPLELSPLFMCGIDYWHGGKP